MKRKTLDFRFFVAAIGTGATLIGLFVPIVTDLNGRAYTYPGFTVNQTETSSHLNLVLSVALGLICGLSWSFARAEKYRAVRLCGWFALLTVALIAVHVLATASGILTNAAEAATSLRLSHWDWGVACLIVGPILLIGAGQSRIPRVRQ